MDNSTSAYMVGGAALTVGGIVWATGAALTGGAMCVGGMAALWYGVRRSRIEERARQALLADAADRQLPEAGGVVVDGVRADVDEKAVARVVYVLIANDQELRANDVALTVFVSGDGGSSTEEYNVPQKVDVPPRGTREVPIVVGVSADPDLVVEGDLHYGNQDPRPYCFRYVGAPQFVPCDADTSKRITRSLSDGFGAGDSLEGRVSIGENVVRKLEELPEEDGNS